MMIASSDFYWLLIWERGHISKPVQLLPRPSYLLNLCEIMTQNVYFPMTCVISCLPERPKVTLSMELCKKKAMHGLDYTDLLYQIWYIIKIWYHQNLVTSESGYIRIWSHQSLVPKFTLLGFQAPKHKLTPNVLSKPTETNRSPWFIPSNLWSHHQWILHGHTISLLWTLWLSKFIPPHFSDLYTILPQRYTSIRERRYKAPNSISIQTIQL